MVESPGTSKPHDEKNALEELLRAENGGTTSPSYQPSCFGGLPGMTGQENDWTASLEGVIVGTKELPSD